MEEKETETFVVIETQSKTVATEIDLSEMLGTKNTTNRESKEYDEDEAESNEEIKVEEGKKDSTSTIKEKEVSIQADSTTRLKLYGFEAQYLGRYN